MTKKFTEEQYQKIVEIAYEYKINSCFGIIGDTTQKSIGSEFYETELFNEIDFYENAKEMMAIFNPLTREWAHDKFVEKEKKYVWQSKQETDDGEVKRLYNAAIGITDSFMDKTEPTHNGNLITETEVKKWGYNIEMFDKRELWWMKK